MNAISYCLDFRYVSCRGSPLPDFGCHLMNFWAILIYHLHLEFLLFLHCLILSCRCLVGMSLLLDFAIEFRFMDSKFRSSGQHILAFELLFLGMGSLSLSLASWRICPMEVNPHPQAGEDGLVLDDFFQCDLSAYYPEDLGSHECSDVSYCYFVMSSKHGRWAHHFAEYRTFHQQLPILTDWQLCQ